MLTGNPLDLDKVYHASFSTPPYQNRVAPLRVYWCMDPPLFPRGRRTRTEMRGVKYEKDAQRELLGRHGCQYVRNPWLIYFCQDARPRYCQPDGLLIRPEIGLVTIVEIKIQHTEKAYFQLTNLYLPVVQRLLADAHQRKAGTGGEAPSWDISLVEVCKWYDGKLVFPEPTRVVQDLQLARPDKFNIHILRP